MMVSLVRLLCRSVDSNYRSVTWYVGCKDIRARLVENKVIKRSRSPHPSVTGN